MYFSILTTLFIFNAVAAQVQDDQADSKDGKSGSDNPYEGADFYQDPNFAKNAGDSGKYGSQPTALWLASDGDLGKLDAIKSAKADKATIMTYVVYDLPVRDCSASASAGGASDIGAYKAVIDKIAGAAKGNTNKNLRLSFILEPDAMANAASKYSEGKCSTAVPVYNEGLAYAISSLSTIPNSWVYVDAGHPDWIKGDLMQKLASNVADVLKNAKNTNPKSTISGFASGVSNYIPLDPQYFVTFGDVLKGAGLPGKFIYDTSRSGQATPKGVWCNPKGAGLGPAPKASPITNVDAYMWIKTPGDLQWIFCFNNNIGESDGSAASDPKCAGPDSTPGAPDAGKWYA